MDMDGWIWMDGWMDGWTDGRTDGWMDGWIYGWMHIWMDGYMDGWMDGWMQVQSMSVKRCTKVKKEADFYHFLQLEARVWGWG